MYAEPYIITSHYYPPFFHSRTNAICAQSRQFFGGQVCAFGAPNLGAFRRRELVPADALPNQPLFPSFSVGVTSLTDGFILSYLTT